MDLRQFFFKGHLEEGEKIVHVVHKHWFVIFAGTFKILLFGFLVPIILFLVFPFSFVFWIMILWMVGATLKILYIILDWYLDAWLLTNIAIIDVKWDGFFKRSAQRIEYQSIEQVAYAYNGFWQTVFRYGTLQIQQPGGVTEIHDIEHPKQTAANLTKLQELFSQQNKYQDEEALKDILTGMIKRHIEKHGVHVNIDNK